MAPNAAMLRHKHMNSVTQPWQLRVRFDGPLSTSTALAAAPGFEVVGAGYICNHADASVMDIRGKVLTLVDVVHLRAEDQRQVLILGVLTGDGLSMPLLHHPGK